MHGLPGDTGHSTQAVNIFQAFPGKTGGRRTLGPLQEKDGQLDRQTRIPFLLPQLLQSLPLGSLRRRQAVFDGLLDGIFIDDIAIRSTA